MVRCGRKLYKRRLRCGRKLYERRLKKLQKMFSNSLSSNVTGLTLALSWAYGFLVRKNFSGRIPRKFTLHGLFVECKEETPKFKWNGRLDKVKKETPKDPSPAPDQKAKHVKRQKFLKVIRKYKMKSRLRKSWPSFNEGKHADTHFWMERWDKHGCKTGLNLIDFLKMSLYLRRLFTTGLNLKKNMPMKAETLIRCIKYHLRANLNLDVTPRIRCQFVPRLVIRRPIRKIQRMIYRRRLYVLEEIKLGVDPKNLKFVDTMMDPYQGCKAKSLVIIPYIKSPPV